MFVAVDKETKLSLSSKRKWPCGTVTCAFPKGETNRVLEGVRFAFGTPVVEKRRAGLWLVEGVRLRFREGRRSPVEAEVFFGGETGVEEALGTSREDEEDAEEVDV